MLHQSEFKSAGKRPRATATGDRLGWVAGVMIVLGAALCFAALMNI